MSKPKFFKLSSPSGDPKGIARCVYDKAAIVACRMTQIISFLLIFGTILGCSTTPVMSPEQLAASLKAEQGEPPQVISVTTGKEALIGEWRGAQTVLTQLAESPDWMDRKIVSQAYQFFPDGKYYHLHEGYAATRTISQGLWDYTNGVLTLQVYKNNIFQRLPPLRVLWHKGMIMELRPMESKDLEIEFAKQFPGKINSHRVRYDEGGWLLQSYDLWYITSTRQNSATSALLMTRLGDATMPPGCGEFKNPIVDDKVLKESIAAHEKYAESMLRISGNVQQMAATMSANNSNGLSPGVEGSTATASNNRTAIAEQQNNPTTSSNVQPKKLNTKRQCGICGTFYDIRGLGCPYCKAPKFGLDATSKCGRCGFTHLTGGKCPSLD